ncbi:hypothetical protein H4Q26_000626 [Puccinia striiformis f. sp. tritici PST-130]|uniref:Uncharacterized protein n=1 Tax=Puccinia striiformis f. sp. tritici PST-78 TaxID=1165861 RepID=A0A0L0VXY6_9BASI|nr:hypothetical protein Pst134EB_002163 [Puccinia striiformis f. sp. tritici]KAI9600832.1 hypothetical protein H4Q26_000626 [Puccinia striiformis f. sp. tritici PST-130]KNF04159.1 hypothetical protein PSTG_02510 [Puccinia striiformis f. sp. tritici PST-78]
MSAKCEPSSSASRSPSPARNASVDPLNLKRDLLVQIESSLLSQLRQHIITLNELLKPADLLHKPTRKLKLISEIQSELDGTLDQIYSATSNILPSSTQASPAGNYDQHLNELKTFRLDRLHYHLTISFLEEISTVCDAYCEVLQAMKFTTMNYDMNDDVFWARQHVIEATDTLFETIERVINWLKGSELDNIQVAWTDQRPGNQDMLNQYLSFSNQRSGSHNQRQLEPFAEQMFKLAKLVIPIIKLYRLFVNKLSERGMNRKQLPKFTMMRTHQLRTIDQLPEDVNNILWNLWGVLRDSNPTEEQSTYRILSRTIQSLDNKFKDPLLLILIYFLPIVPDTDGFPTRQYFNEWFATWKTLFTIAISNFLRAVPPFMYHPL